ncbi:hypothetical protein B0H10DRAFT_2059871 [Mycena sp. CBHHK59/15]|nr:hypothetical protein B0H10DRAFT_2059871 [Mycena sp. CBHHK59/15]
MGAASRCVGTADGPAELGGLCAGRAQGVVVSTHRSRPTHAWSHQHPAGVGDRRRWGARNGIGAGSRRTSGGA